MNNMNEAGYSYKEIDLINDDEVPSGIWIYVLCSVSNYDESFFIVGNDLIEETSTLNKETIYKIGSNEYKTEYPMKYFMSSTNSLTTELRLENLKNSVKIYFRSIQLFRDYIPMNYDIKYEDLTKITNSYMPSLVLASNFADVIVDNEDPNNINITFVYYVYTMNLESTNGRQYTRVQYKKYKTLSGVSFELSANFIFLPLCDFTDRQTYDEETNSCKRFSECPNEAQYCLNDNIAFVCLNNYYINLAETITCDNKCNNDKMRIPGTMESKGICSITKSSDISLTALQDYPNNIDCTSSSFNLIDYKCKSDSEQTSALFYSRCYNPPNFYKTLSNSVKQKFASGYLLEFWIRFDHSLFFCDHETIEYYFYSTPHSIYHDNEQNLYYYQIIGNPFYKYQLSDISKYEWNKIVIRTTLGSTTGQNVIVYVN